MLLNILLVILVLDCIALVAVILLQQSEGGALGMGGGRREGSKDQKERKRTHAEKH